ncbi:YdeI/OmpD-associated family protein [Georgenia daeguensis]|uniref:YdeI/OmpD-associated family protein n=1 Tax=Georgenia daeguensis TaxID=908355 RepID=A0ABP8EXK9_9MICO
MTQEELLLPDAAAWRAWLEEHHDSSDGVWLVIGKKGGATTALTYEAAVLEALCFGWIDGQTRRRDEGTFAQRLTPRRPRSPWSASNVRRVAQLEAEGRMTEAGRAAVRAAQADGRWDRAYVGQADAEPPADLLAALNAEPRARAMFDLLTRSNRFAVIYRVTEAKRPETRARRIAGFVETLARGESPYPQKRRLEDPPA